MPVQRGCTREQLPVAPPYIVAIAGLYLNARAADRNGRYAFHVMLSLAVAAVTLVASVLLGDIAWLSIALVSLAMAGALAYDGPFRASASRAMPVAVAGTAMGLVNALGNLGGFVGPYVGGYLQDLSHGASASVHPGQDVELGRLPRLGDRRAQLRSGGLS